jgi:NADPH:quinone reductase
VLKLEELLAPQSGKGEVRIKVEAIGLNRAEVMLRNGQYLINPNSLPHSVTRLPGPLKKLVQG